MSRDQPFAFSVQIGAAFSTDRAFSIRKCGIISSARRYGVELGGPSRTWTSLRRVRRRGVVVAWLRGVPEDNFVVREARSYARLIGGVVQLVSKEEDGLGRIGGCPVGRGETVVDRCLSLGSRYLVYGGKRDDLEESLGRRNGFLVHRVGCFPVPTAGGVLMATAMIPLIVEHLGDGVSVSYRDDDGKLRGGKPSDNRSPKKKILDALKEIYLPAGYPHSVSTDYLAFTRWRVLQNLASAVMAVVSTEALLFGLGLGKQATAATAAATQWVLKDGFGYIGKVIYGYVAGKQFDHDPKSWRILSDTVEDAGGVLELLTPMFPGNFLVLASVANALKGVAAMTGTATRHAIYKSLALRENQGDIATKGESQGVTCKMLGLAMGIAVSNSIGQNYRRLIAAYSMFAVIHLAANWQSMKCVQFTTLNRQRCSILIRAFLNGDEMPDPYDVSHHEQILFRPWRGFRPNVILGSSLSDAVSSSSELTSAIQQAGNDRFLLSTPTPHSVRIVLSKKAVAEDLLRAYFTAEYFLSQPLSSRDMKSAKKYTNRNFSRFVKCAQNQGWSTEYAMLNPRGSRSSW